MASAVVTSVAKKLGDLLIQEALLLYGVEDDIRWIRTELTRMECFLKDADSGEQKDETVKRWVADIIQVSYDAEDVIDTCSQSVLRKRRGFAAWVERCVCVICELKARHTVAKEIERIRREIDDISKSRERYGIRNINEGRQEASTSTSNLQGRRRFSTELEETAQVIGLQEEMNAVKVQLIKGEPRHCVVSIVGMGGSGKTTLAKKVYGDVKDDFDCRAFIYLSQQYEIREILMNILECVKILSLKEIEKIEKMNVTALGKMLRDHLREKKYLVVVDDIWSIEAWNQLKLIFPDDVSESRVMLTTRNKDVALHAGPSSHHHHMRPLNDDEGWELFTNKIFPGGDPCPTNLEKIGRKIVAECRGLPLAILVSRGLAGKAKTFDAWSRVLKSVNRHLNESSGECRQILALSYWDLPLYLKPCFLYLGLLPKDYEISSGRLIRLWIAEGFIQPRVEGEELEDIAEEYLEELVARSMIEVASRKSNGSVGKCFIHDLLRELSISEARQNNFFTIHKDRGTTSSSTSVRRLALHCNIDGYENKKAALRSILSFLNHEGAWEKLHNTYGKLLTVVDAHDEQIYRDKFPKKLGEFVLLRYLELGCYTKVRIPSSIGNLYSLQTLCLRGYGTLPNAICNLGRLRHLHAYGFDIDGHPQLNNLEYLQTLCLRAGNWIKDGFGELTTLRKLGINGDLSSYHKELCESIDKLDNLGSLKLLNGCSIPPFRPFTGHSHLYKMVLHGRMEKPLEIPPTVRLTLEDSGLEQAGRIEKPKPPEKPKPAPPPTKPKPSPPPPPETTPPPPPPPKPAPPPMKPTPSPPPPPKPARPPPETAPPPPPPTKPKPSPPPPPKPARPLPEKGRPPPPPPESGRPPPPPPKSGRPPPPPPKPEPPEIQPIVRLTLEDSGLEQAGRIEKRPEIPPTVGLTLEDSGLKQADISPWEKPHGNAYPRPGQIKRRIKMEMLRMSLEAQMKQASTESGEN